MEKPAYAGIGSRETPRDILSLMTKFARHMESRGWVLRSGGAAGADSAFEAGTTSGMRQIYLPWREFMGNPSPLFNTPSKAFDIGDEHHPYLRSLSFENRIKATPSNRKILDFNFHSRKVQTLRKLMARNAQQVLGENLDSPSKFVVCWTPDGADGTIKLTSDKTGGTGQAIRIAAANGVKVYNMADPKHLEYILGKIQIQKAA